MPTIMSFHGAVGMVTGSCHLLKTGGLNLLIDCGLFQGENRWRSLNHGDFGFDASEIDFLLLTHAHLDHSGRIPLLHKAGFKGQIICTSATHDIAKVILMDSARVQEEDYEHFKYLGKHRTGDAERPKPPLYTTMDVMDAMHLFSPRAMYGKPIRLNDRVTVTYHDAGHILGAAFLEIEVRDQRRIVYSGDLGNTQKPIIRDPDPLPKDVDTLVLETTYGDRNHKSFGDSVQELRKIISTTFARGGNVVIPSFAVERAQDLLFVLRDMYDQKQLPKCSVFLDSPMGIDVTNIMRRHPECLDAEALTHFRNHHDPFDFPGLQMTKSQRSSVQINFIRSHSIVIAGAGMCNGGRIRYHLKNNLWRQESSIVFLGFQAEGTLGRTIVEGAKKVSFFNETFNVNAEIHTIGGFSSHADRSTMLGWLGKQKPVDNLFLLHGEPRSTSSFKDAVAEAGLAKTIHMPSLHEKFTL